MFKNYHCCHCGGELKVGKEITSCKSCGNFGHTEQILYHSKEKLKERNLKKVMIQYEKVRQGGLT